MGHVPGHPGGVTTDADGIDDAARHEIDTHDASRIGNAARVDAHALAARIAALLHGAVVRSRLVAAEVRYVRGRAVGRDDGCDGGDAEWHRGERRSGVGVDDREAILDGERHDREPAP